MNWTVNTDIVEAGAFAPSLAAFDNGVNTQLYVAFLAGNRTLGGPGTGTVLVSSTADGVNWTGNTKTGQLSATAPSLTVF